MAAASLVVFLAMPVEWTGANSGGTSWKLYSDAKGHYNIVAKGTGRLRETTRVPPADGS